MAVAVVDMTVEATAVPAEMARVCDVIGVVVRILVIAGVVLVALWDRLVLVILHTQWGR